MELILQIWDNVKDKSQVLYVSEDLSKYSSLEGKYEYFKSLKAIVTLGSTSNVTNMSSMFKGCSSLTDLSPLKDWNTNNVTNMRRMFDGCSSLTDISPLIESESPSENDSDITPHPYQGDDDYVFISYAHLDTEPVLSELKYFEEFGINIWYDEGITPSTEWPEVIQEKLEKSLLLIIFITPNSIESQNVRNEINYASSINKPFIPIHLKNTKLKYGMGIQLGSVQAILKYELDAESYVEKCIKSFKLNGLDIKNIPSTISLKYQKYDENEEDEKEIIELKQTFNNEENMLNLHWDLNQIFLEMKHSNNLKEFELGVIDEKEFNQRRNKYNNLLKKLYEKRNN